MSNTLTKVNYSEVYSILSLVEPELIEKLPKKLYSLIEENRDEEYNPVYDVEKPLKEQNISKEAISLIAVIHLKYWCETQEEKDKLNEIFSENSRKIEEEKSKKYSSDKLFQKQASVLEKSEEILDDIEDEGTKSELQMTIVKEENIFRKIFNKIISIFKK